LVADRVAGLERHRKEEVRQLVRNLLGGIN
jgi:hypothetical protein